MLSESEFEDDPNSQVILPQNLASRGAAAESKSAIRLFELGPRISFQLIKVFLVYKYASTQLKRLHQYLDRYMKRRERERERIF